MTENISILAVDADPLLRDRYMHFLTQHGCSVVVAGDTESMDHALLEQHFDLMILDVMLSGFEILLRLRSQKSKLPVIVVSALVGEEARITGLENGADDYLAKPFNSRELLARIRAILRRSRPKTTPGAPSVDGEIIRFGSMTLDLSTRSLIRDGVEIPITTTDFATLKAFARYPNQPLSRQRLMYLSRGRAYEASDRSLDVQISKLRRFIESDPQNPKYLQTVEGVGYILISDVT